MPDTPVVGTKEATREDFRSYWVEEHGAPTIENMMLDTNAVAMDVLERPEILAELPSLDSKVVLELGAGIGRFSCALAEKAARVVAVDFVDASCKINRESNARFSNLEVVCEDALKLEFEPNSFDIVFSNWLLMYLSDAEVQILANNCITWLKPGGRIFFRESCFHRSGNAPRTWNPTVYRDPRTYFKFFNSARSSDGCRFQLCKTSCVHAYVRIKNNPNQVWWIWEKCSSGHLIRYLDTQQYDYNSVFRYEKMYGPGFMSTGGKALLEQIVESVPLKPGDRVLDVGCGFGGNMLHFAQRGCYVHGIDISGMMVSIASERYLKLPPAIQQAMSISVGDIFSVEFIPNSFDVICVRDFLMHFSEGDKQILITKFNRWLAPGGSLIVTDYVCKKTVSEWSLNFENYVAQRKYSLSRVSDYLRMMKTFNEVNELKGFLSTKASFIKYLQDQIVSYRELVSECREKIEKFQNKVKEETVFNAVYSAVVGAVTDSPQDDTKDLSFTSDDHSDELAGVVAQSAAEIAKRYIDSKTKILNDEEMNLDWVQKYWNLKIDACSSDELATGTFATAGAASEVPTSVYVGHICGKIKDASVKELLEVCGPVVSWNRMGHFGFCEFTNIQSAARAIKFLDGRQLGSKRLVIKSDSKVANFQTTNLEGESTVGALLTRINTDWRKEAMISDLALEPTPMVDDDAKPFHQAVNVKRKWVNMNEDCLPNWFKDSRKESDRLLRIGRKRNERKSEFERAVKYWEQKEMKKLLENDIQNDISLKDQDGIDGYKVRSNFNVTDRRREIEFDEEDELKEKEELKEVLGKFQLFAGVKKNDQFGIVTRIARGVPKTVGELEKFTFDFDTIFGNKLACQQLSSWIGAKSDPVLANLVLEMIRKDKLTVNELSFKLNLFAGNINETNIDLLAIKIFQMLAYIQLSAL